MCLSIFLSCCRLISAFFLGFLNCLLRDSAVLTHIVAVWLICSRKWIVQYLHPTAPHTLQVSNICAMVCTPPFSAVSTCLPSLGAGVDSETESCPEMTTNIAVLYLSRYNSHWFTVILSSRSACRRISVNTDPRHRHT